MISTRIFSIFLFILSAFLVYHGLDINPKFSYEPLGPKPFPIASLSLIMICCVLLLFFAEDTNVHWGDLGLWKKLIVLVASLFIFAEIFEYLGFIISSFLLMSVMSLLFGAKTVQGLIFAALSSVILFYVFDELLQITLPWGEIFETLNSNSN